MEPKAKQYIDRFQKLEERRRNWDNQWQDVSELVSPDREFNAKTEKGSERRTRIYDNTAPIAKSRLQGGLNSLLWNQALKWIKVGVQGHDTDDDAASRWLSNTSDAILEVGKDPSVNLYPALDEAADDVILYGTCGVFTDREDGLRFRAIPMSSLYIEEDAMGMVETVYRRFDLTPRQAAGMFGVKALPEKTRLNLENGRDEEEQYLHCVGPRQAWNPRSPYATDMPYYSVVIHLDQKAVVSEGGFRTPRFVVARWRKAAGETYGRGPAMDVLQEIRVVNAMAKSALAAAMKQADPPVQAPDDGFLQPLSLHPGGINYYRSSMQGRIEPIQTGARADIAEQLIELRRQDIRRAFFNDMFELPVVDRATAYEVSRRLDQMRQLFAPTLTRLYTELLDPIVYELYTYANARGLIEPPPASIQGRGMRVFYESPLAKSMQSSEATAFTEWFAAISPMAQADPTILDLVHPDRTARKLANALSMHDDMLRTPDELNTLRTERVRQQQAQQEAQQAQMLASAAKDGASALGDLRM